MVSTRSSLPPTPKGTAEQPVASSIRVVAHAAHPELKVETVDGDMAGTEAAGAKRASTRFRVADRVTGGERRRDRSAGGPRSAVDAVDLLGRRREVVTEGRVLDLRVPQHLLGGERVGGQILEPWRRSPTLPLTSVEGGAAGDSTSLLVPPLCPDLRERVELEKVLAPEVQTRNSSTGPGG